MLLLDMAEGELLMPLVLVANVDHHLRVLLMLLVLDVGEVDEVDDPLRLGIGVTRGLDSYFRPFPGVRGHNGVLTLIAESV